MLDRPSALSLAVLTLAVALSLPGSAGALDFGVQSSATMPILDSDTIFEVGGSLGAEATFRWAGVPLSTSTALEALNLPHKARASLLLAIARQGLALEIGLGGGQSLSFSTDVGGYLVTRSDLTRYDGNLWLAGGTGWRWVLEPSLAFSATIEYQTALGLYQGVGLRLGFELMEDRREP